GEARPDRPVLLEIAPVPGTIFAQTAIVDGTTKLVLQGAGNYPKLYDLESDPGERRNLALSRPDAVARMKIALHKALMPATSSPVAGKRLRGVISATEDPAEKEALRRAQEAQKRREALELGMPPPTPCAEVLSRPAF